MYIIVVIEAEYKSEIELKRNTPYLSQMGELRNYFVRIWEKVDRVITTQPWDNQMPSFT